MYLFNKDKRREVLKGRTVRYLANNYIKCSEVHLSNVLNGKITCSYSFAKNITECSNKEARVEDYFIKLEK